MSNEREILIATTEDICRKMERGDHDFKLQMISTINSFPEALEMMRDIVESRDRIENMKRERSKR